MTTLLTTGTRLLQTLNLKKHEVKICSRLFSSVDEGALKKLNHFLKNEKVTVNRLNEEFALPYADINTIGKNLHQILEGRTSQNALLTASYAGQLHRPAIPMKFITENISTVEENIRKRKLPGVEIDVQRDIIAPFQRMQKLKEEEEKVRGKKIVLTNAMKEFWVNYSKNKEVPVPPEIEKQRQGSIKLGCILSLLAWIEAEVERLFYEKALLVPNMTHPSVPVGEESAAIIMKTVNEKTKPEILPVNHFDVGESTGHIWQNNITYFSGHRTYYLLNEVADLEQALVRYTLDKLRVKGFNFISCPNIFHGSAFEGCGVASTKISDMLYRIDPEQEEDFYIAGTSEVGIAAYFANHAISLKHLPLKMCSVSTCNRKETNNKLDPRGIYRVHHFTKVEMFGITANETGKESEELFQEFLEVQEELYKDLGLHFRIVNMPTMELGLPAYQKVDMEAWMNARDSYGEISSTSNCTDFQSRRLHILYKAGAEYKFAHTLNGTACAAPRVIIALVENNQTKDRTVELPEILQPYMKRTTLDKSGKIVMEYIGPNQSKNKRKTPK